MPFEESMCNAKQRQSLPFTRSPDAADRFCPDSKLLCCNSLERIGFAFDSRRLHSSICKLVKDNELQFHKRLAKNPLLLFFRELDGLIQEVFSNPYEQSPRETLPEYSQNRRTESA